jgi:hypothetical protein
MLEPNYDDILNSKFSYYGETKAAYQFAAEEYARQYFELNKNSVLGGVINTIKIDESKVIVSKPRMISENYKD